MIALISKTNMYSIVSFFGYGVILLIITPKIAIDKVCAKNSDIKFIMNSVLL